MVRNRGGGGLIRLTRAALVAAALAGVAVLLAAGKSERVEAHHLCASTGSPFGPFNITTYEAADYKNLYARTIELAAFNDLFGDIGSFAMPAVETGAREAGSAQTVDPYIPPTLLKSIAFNESGWAQASYSPLVDYGETGPVLSSHDCGYGIMQVTTGMQNVSGVPTLDQAMIGTHFAFNVARGSKILAEKWNMSPEFRPVIGDRNPQVVENWYYAVWGYNGWAFQNHPLNPAYSPGRAPFSCGPANDGLGHDKSQYPYQELIMGCASHPPVKSGTQLWAPLEVHLPELTNPAFAEPLKVENWNACSYSSQCTPMDIPTPNTFHQDPTTIAQTRADVIGAPSIVLSSDSVSIALEPGVTAGQATVTVSNPGSGVLGFRAVSSASWLKVSPQATVALASDLGSKPAVLTITANVAGLAGGTHSGKITVQSLYGGTRSINVSVSTAAAADTTLIKGSGPEVYKLFGNVRRHVPNAATFEAWGFRWDLIKTVSDGELAQYVQGDPLLDVTADGRLVWGLGHTAVYVMQGGARRHVTSPAAMSACGYSFDSPVTLPDHILAGFPEGAPVSGAPCPRFIPAEGRLIWGPDRTAVYIMQGGLRRHVPSLLTFEAKGLYFENVDAISDAELAAIPPGNPLPDVGATGSLVWGPDHAAVYVMDGGAKRHVASMAIMTACGYGLDAVTTLSAGTINSIPTGTQLTATPCPKRTFGAGSLVRGSGPAIYAVDTYGNRRHVASAEVFTSCGYQWGNVDVLPDSVIGAMYEWAPVTAPPCP